ncbi:MAG: PTS system fructose-specific EIIABC component [Chlamydiales bacterium]|nr:PTS system fructose-specific EIIABC component [Chlamydiales bacterium]MCH9635489.1 PTS system fructose-specific EIIABC component [Chlamydiales bacterium]MCH9704009.1 PTS sugar transporter subunit IIA [Chlamydiota bacterium]
MIRDFLDEKLITFLDVDDQEGALQQLVALLDHEKKLLDCHQFYEAILKREAIVSTGIGMGVAVPHAKLPGYHSFFIAVGIHPKGIAWDALDGVPVRLIFMIGGPEDQQTKYLQLLSRLTLAIKDEQRRKKMLQLKNPSEMMALFEGI